MGKPESSMFPLGAAALAVCLAVAACSASSSEGGSCLDRLNDRAYAEVAADASCSTYERGSAELGLAGFEFSSFIASDALTNFPNTLGLDATGCAESGTESLDVDRGYYSTYHRHYLRSQYHTRWSYTSVNESQPLYDAEIALFASAGEIAAQSYCEIDGNLDGGLTGDEIFSFFVIDTPSGTISVSQPGYLLVVNDGAPWLLDVSGSTVQCLASPDYTSVWSRLSGTPSTGSACTNLISGASEVSLVVSIDELPTVFQEGATVSDLDGPFNLLNSALQKSDDITQDLDAIGLDQGSDLRDAVENQLTRIDNGGLDGGSCGSTGEAVLPSVQILTELLESVEQAESYDADGLDLSAGNVFVLNDFEGITGATLTCPDEASACATVRLIYASGSGHTDLYHLADTGIAQTLALAAYVTLDPDTADPWVNEAGDFNVSFEELVCLQ